MTKHLLYYISLVALMITAPVLAQTKADEERALQLVADIIHSETNGISSELNELLSIYRRQYSEQSAQYADALMWAAMACTELGDNKQGQQLLKKSDQFFAQYGNGPFEGRDTIQQIFRYDLRSNLLYNSGAAYRALKQSKRSLQLKKQYFGLNNEVYLNELLNVSHLYAKRLKYSKSNRYHNMGYHSYVELIKKEFCSTSESERTLYWEKASRYISKTVELAHKAGRKSQQGGNESLASAAYNAMLLSKGLLLNTTIGFENYINNSTNEEAIRNLRLKKQLSDAQANQNTLDSLDYVILQALQAKGQSFTLPHLSISWTDVAQRLSDNDLAIEFYRTADNNYGAILLKHDWKSPRVVRLKGVVDMGKKYLTLSNVMDSLTLENYTPDKAEALWHLSKAIWTDDIVRHFPENGQGRIYFAADGQLLITGIEYLPFIRPNADGSFSTIADLFDIYRLSSTRELAITPLSSTSSDVAVYGGLRYDMYADDMYLTYEPTEHQRTVRVADRAIKYLEGTEVEAESIIATINGAANHSLIAKPYIGEHGTETSFKSLSSKGPRIIHVATHGFFYNESDSTFDRFHLGNNPMVRSGLFFSGADNKWLGDELPVDVDDGFLTSLEISNLDFRGLDLVVLSACETGKGNIKGDGVFGLQRGFKMASANSILMSLWKVDDDATCLLMTEFYNKWIGEGKTKHEALELAKQTVRSHTEKGWHNPKYWAAFILLDGID